MTATAIVLATHVDRRGIRTVTVRCPYCKRRHIHGWPLSSADPGVRASHCHSGDYLISGPE